MRVLHENIGKRVTLEVTRPSHLAYVSPPPRMPKLIDVDTGEEVPVIKWERKTVTVHVDREKLREGMRRYLENLNELQRGIRRVFLEVTRVNRLTVHEVERVKREVVPYGEELMRAKILGGEVPPRITPIIVNTVYGVEYICPLCGATYYDIHTLERHMRTVHHVEVIY